MADDALFLPGLSPVAGKPVHVAFDGGRLTSDAGVLLLAEIQGKLGIAERLDCCIADPRAPERVRHGFAEMIRYRALLIAAGYPDANDCDALRDDPAFKMAVGRVELSLQAKPRPLRRPRLAAMINGATCPLSSPVPSTTNAVIEDRKRAPSATLTHARSRTPNRPRELSGLKREVRELRQANEILRRASACFAMAELDRRSKT